MHTRLRGTGDGKNPVQSGNGPAETVPSNSSSGRHGNRPDSCRPGIISADRGFNRRIKNRCVCVFLWPENYRPFFFLFCFFRSVKAGVCARGLTDIRDFLVM